MRMLTLRRRVTQSVVEVRGVGARLQFSSKEGAGSHQIRIRMLTLRMRVTQSVVEVRDVEARLRFNLKEGGESYQSRG